MHSSPRPEPEPSIPPPFSPMAGAPGSPAAVRTLLRSLGLRPQKGFGQNFLVDEAILGRIVHAADLQPSDLVIEVGPGLGHLTRHLAAHAGRVIAIEIDRGIVRALRRLFQETPNVEIIEQDVLRIRPEELVGDCPYKVIGNLPYYITSPVLRLFLEAPRRPSLMVVMVQREVASRILARPGDLSLLAISVQAYGQPRLVARVPPSAFFPRPKVESAVLRIDVYDHPRFDSPPSAFFRVVAAGFAMPRKQLHNALAQRIWMPPDSAPAILREAGIDPARRAQTLTIPEWDRLTSILIERRLVS